MKKKIILKLKIINKYILINIQLNEIKLISENI